MREKIENERWVPIEGFDGYYEISDHGNVRSLDRVIVDSVGRKNPLKGTLLKPSTNTKYLSIHLLKKDINIRCYIHILVAKHFIPNDDPINKTQVDHKKEGDVRNNHYTNLQWLTPRDNSIKYVLSKKKASKHIGVRLTSNATFKWRAVITLNKKPRHLGVFITEEEAAEAYQKGLKYIQLHGELPPKIN